MERRPKSVSVLAWLLLQDIRRATRAAANRLICHAAFLPVCVDCLFPEEEHEGNGVRRRVALEVLAQLANQMPEVEEAEASPQNMLSPT